MADAAPAPAGAVPSEGLPPDADAGDLALPAVEMDTADDEEASSSWEALRSTLLPPDGASLPTTADGTFIPAFALLVNGSALNAWVKQPSPSCAAAVVAGAWNALACAGGRRDARAMGVRDVLDAMALGAETNLARKKARFARLLGVSSDAFDAFERAVLERIASDPSGATLGGRSKADPAMRRGDAMRVVEETATSMTKGETSSFAGDADDVSSIEETCHDAEDAFGAVAALLREEKAGKRRTKTKTPERASSETSSENEPACVADVDPRGAEGKKVANEVANEDARQPKQKKKPTKKGTSFPKKTLTRLGPPSAAFLGASSGIQSRNLGVSNDENESASNDGDASASSAASDDDDDGEKKIKKFDWRAEIWSVLKARAGLEKLRREKPSTAAFGNAEVMRVFRRLVETRTNETNSSPRANETEKSYVFSARVAFGIKTKTRPSLEAAIAKHASSDTDVETTRASHEWHALRALFARPGVFLVSHHANHYAPVYALRERREENANNAGDDGDDFARDSREIRWRETREMLTARRGQRPAVWIPWEEARATMRRWSGYGIMAFERREA